MEKGKSKKERHEPWYLMYLFFIPVFLIAVVPEGFFTWQVIVIFGILMAIPFVFAWFWYRKEPSSPFMEQYLEHLKENKDKSKEG